MIDVGRIYRSPHERKGLPDGHTVYEIAHERKSGAWWGLLHWAWCWLRLQPHIQHWDEHGVEVFNRWWVLRLGSRKPGKWGLSLYYHRYFTDHADLAEHTHPRDCVRLVLTGGYWERISLGYANAGYSWFVSPWSWRQMVLRRWQRHRITEVKPGTRTLFLMVGRFEPWRVMTEDGSQVMP